MFFRNYVEKIQVPLKSDKNNAGTSHEYDCTCMTVKKQSIPRQTEVALGVLGRLRPRIFSTFGTTRLVGCQPNAPAAFTPGEIPSTHFHMVLSEGTTEKKSQVTSPGIDPGTVRLVAQRLNHHATPGPISIYIYIDI